MSESNELLPCPFCGEKLIEMSDHHGTWMGHRDTSCWESVSQIHDKRDVERWNRRSAAPVAQGEQTYWLIERSSPAQYLSLYDEGKSLWSTDIANAKRFSSKELAELTNNYRCDFENGEPPRVVEHMDITGENTFKPDWANYKQGRLDGMAEAKELMLAALTQPQQPAKRLTCEHYQWPEDCDLCLAARETTAQQPAEETASVADKKRRLTWAEIETTRNAILNDLPFSDERINALCDQAAELTDGPNEMYLAQQKELHNSGILKLLSGAEYVAPSSYACGEPYGCSTPVACARNGRCQKTKETAARTPPASPQFDTARDPHKGGATLAGNKRTEEDSVKPSSRVEQCVAAATPPDHVVEATWYISLDCVCPACLQDIDLFAQDGWPDREIHVGESRKTIDVECDKCKHEFKAKLEY